MTFCATAASAQTAPAAAATPAAAPARFELRVDVVAQGKPKTLSDAFDVPLYQETEHVTVHYPDLGEVLASVGARYTVWRHLAVGVSYAQFARNGDTAVQASVPHPFFDNQFRKVEGTASTRRQEVTVAIPIGWLIPLSSKAHLAVSVGPAFISVKQSLVTGVKITEQYPFDTATFASADVRYASHSATGVYGGADLTWLFSRHVGVGGLVHVTHANLRLTGGDRTVSISAGGVQAGGGIRLVF